MFFLTTSKPKLADSLGFLPVLCVQGCKYFLKIIYLLIFLAMLGLQSCVQGFSTFGEGDYSLVVVCGLLIALTSLVAEHGL